MAGNERSFDLILKAQVGQALQPLEQVVQRMKDLVGVLNQQQQAATRGETSIGQYSKALRDVESASGDLLKQRAALDALAEAHKRVADAEDTVNKRREARDTKIASLPAEGDRSDAQVRAAARVEAALERAQAARDKAAAGEARTIANLTRIGVLTEQLTTHEERLAALGGAHDVLDSYILLAGEALKAGHAQSDVLIETLKLGAAEKQAAEQRARDTSRFLADQEKRTKAVLDEAEAVRAAGRAAQARVDEQSPLNARRFDVEEAFRAQEVEQRLASEREKNARAFQAQQRTLADAVRSVYEEEDRGLAQTRAHLAAFEAEVKAAQTRLGALSTAPVPAGASALGAVSAVAGPGRERVRDTQDVQAATEQLEQAVNKGKLSAQSYNKILDDVYAAQRRIAQDAALIDQFNAQTAAVERATEAFVREETEFLRLSAVATRTETTLKQLRVAEDRLATATLNLQKENTALAATNSQLEKRRLNTANLKGEVDRLVESSQRLAVVQEKASGGGDKLFGLSVYQLQNLSFQINDVITQLSLGQGVMRTVASQGGQIAQIFETNIAAMAKVVLIALPAAAAIGLVAAALLRLNDTAAAQRAFAAGFAGTVDGAGKSSAALVTLQRDLEKQGVAFKDAGEAIRQFQNDLSPERIRQLTTAAQNMTLAFGTEFKDNVKALSPVVDGTVEDLQKLLQEQQLLTPELVKYFQTVKEGGSLEEARARTLNLLATRALDAKNVGIGPLTQAWIDLKNAFNGFLDAIGSATLLQTIITDVKELVTDITILVGWFTAAKEEIDKLGGDGTFAKFSDEVKRALNPVQFLVDGLKLLHAQRDTGALKALKDFDAQINGLKKDTDAAKNTYEDFKKRFGEGATDNPVLEGLKRQADELEAKLQAAIAARDKLIAGGVPTVPTAGTPTGVGARGLSSAPATAALIDNTAKILGLDQSLTNFATQIIQTESSGRHFNEDGSVKLGELIKTGPQAGKRAIGAGQVLPDVAGGSVRTVNGEAFDLRDETQNIRASLTLLSEAYKKHNGDLREVAKDYVGRGTSEAAVAERTKYLAGLEARGAFAGTRGLGGNNPVTGAAVNQKAADEIERNLTIERGQREKGNVDLRIKADEAIEARRKEADIEEARRITGRSELDAENLAKIEAASKERARLQKRVRDTEDAEKALSDQQLRSQLENRYASKDPTNLAARIKKANDEFDADMLKVKKAAAEGKQDIEGVSFDKFTESVKKIRDQAVALATVDADNAGLDALVKERDDKIKAIKEKAASSTITLGEAATQMAAVIAQFGPKIKDAVGRSNAALGNVEQTPAVKERLARNTTIDPDDKKANADLLKSGEDSLTKLVGARTAAVKAQEYEVKNLTKTQREADVEIRKAYNEYNPKIRQTLDDLERQNELYGRTGAGGAEAYEKLKAKIAETRAELNLVDAAQVRFNQQVESVVSGSAVKAFDSIAEGIGKAIAGTDTWANAMKNAGRAFGQFVADVLKGIAEIILKEQILAAVKAITAAIGAAHAGGVAGSTTMTRSGISPLAFIAAPRFHSGGVVGLASDEIPTILKRGEEVITEKDARHVKNGGKNVGSEVTSGATSIRQVLVLDPKDLSSALAGGHGAQTVITHIKNNAATIKNMLR